MNGHPVEKLAETAQRNGRIGMLTRRVKLTIGVGAVLPANQSRALTSNKTNSVAQEARYFQQPSIHEATTPTVAQASVGVLFLVPVENARAEKSAPYHCPKDNPDYHVYVFLITVEPAHRLHRNNVPEPQVHHHKGESKCTNHHA
jgi:hypothetical protein